jgi:DNA-binding transcriptional regulator YdaS (Cro superfamily)
MKTKEAIKLAGGKTMLARILGLTPAAVTQWGDSVPELRTYQLRDKRPEWFAKQKSRAAA